jgi:hypothetical protein
MVFLELARQLDDASPIYGGHCLRPFASPPPS